MGYSLARTQMNEKVSEVCPYISFEPWNGLVP